MLFLIGLFLKLSFKYLSLFYMHECFVYMYISALHVCLLPVEEGGSWIPLNWSKE